MRRGAWGGCQTPETPKFFPPTVWEPAKALSVRKHTTSKGALTLDFSAFRAARIPLCSQSSHSVVRDEYFFSEVLGTNRSISAKDIFGIFTQIQRGEPLLIQNLEMF